MPETTHAEETSCFAEEKGWNGKVIGRDNTTLGFLREWDALFGDDPTDLDLNLVMHIPRISLPKSLPILKVTDAQT